LFNSYVPAHVAHNLVNPTGSKSNLPHLPQPPLRKSNFPAVSLMYCSIRPRLPFRAESVVLMTPRSTYAVAYQPCESMVCKFSPTQRVKLAHVERTRFLLQLPPLCNLQ
jgi:hypothetical protein